MIGSLKDYCYLLQIAVEINTNDWKGILSQMMKSFSYNMKYQQSCSYKFSLGA